MFCPQCGANQSEELKFCNLCGANLQAVRQAVATRETGEKFDWSKTWVAEMFLSEEERKRRTHQLEQERGETAEIKRYNEIKAGVITSSVGVGAAIFLFIFMEGIILSSPNSNDKEILSRLWIAGVVPFLIGLAIMINGIFISKKIVELERRRSPSRTEPGALDGQQTDTAPRHLNSADTTEFVSPNFSVTEDPTKHLTPSRRKQ